MAGRYLALGGKKFSLLTCQPASQQASQPGTTKDVNLPDLPRTPVPRKPTTTNGGGTRVERMGPDGDDASREVGPEKVCGADRAGEGRGGGGGRELSMEAVNAGPF